MLVKYFQNSEKYQLVFQKKAPNNIWILYKKHHIVLNTYSMKTYALLHFERQNEVTIIVKLLYRATSRRQKLTYEF